MTHPFHYNIHDCQAENILVKSLLKPCPKSDAQRSHHPRSLYLQQELVYRQKEPVDTVQSDEYSIPIPDVNLMLSVYPYIEK